MNLSLIHFHSEDVSVRMRHSSAVKLWLLEAIKMEGFSMGPLSFIWCSDKHLLELNITFLQHDTYTDIITFDYGNAHEVSGELYISIDRIRDNSKYYQSAYWDELHRVMVHGVLHLCGYKDKTVKEKAKMTEKEDYYLNLRDFKKH
jgi:rRNA maturation RNase YbeY